MSALDTCIDLINARRDVLAKNQKNPFLKTKLVSTKLPRHMNQFLRSRKQMCKWKISQAIGCFGFKNNNGGVADIVMEYLKDSPLPRRKRYCVFCAGRRYLFGYTHHYSCPISTVGHVLFGADETKLSVLLTEDQFEHVRNYMKRKKTPLVEKVHEILIPYWDEMGIKYNKKHVQSCLLL